MVGYILKAIVIFAVMAAAVKVYIMYYERRLIYFPVKVVNQTPADIGLSYEWRRFLTYDGHQLTGWWIPHPEPVASLLFFHGNAGNIGDRIHNLLLFNRAGFSVFIFDYRGYGESEGKPDEEGLKMDADAAYEELTAQIGVPPEQIIFFGRSLGGVMAAHAARGRPIRGLILEGCFSSAGDMAEVIFYPLRIPRAFVGAKLETSSYLNLRKCPLLVIHGTHDEVIPFRLGQKLFDGAAEPKSFHVVERGGHNDCYMVGGDTYFARLTSFARTGDGAPPPP